MSKKSKELDDWERIENGEIDALIFEHSDYYNIFHSLLGHRIQMVVEKPEQNLKDVLEEFALKNVERIKMED